MEMGIAIFLGAFLIGIGILAYCRISKDFNSWIDTSYIY